MKRLRQTRLLTVLGHLESLRYNRLLGPLVSRAQRRDDYAWDTYTQDSYRPRLERASTRETRQLGEVPWMVAGGCIVVENAAPLNPTHKIIYETILALRPSSICEFGFGGGDHLANLGLLLPTAALSGFEISQQQVDFALTRNGLREIALHVKDMTKEAASAGFEDSAELVFSNAVMMHIHGAGRHVTFLMNMLRVSRRYVLFAENWLRHDYVRDMHALGLRPHVVSQGDRCVVLLDLRNDVPYPEVRSDKQLRGYQY